MFHYILNMILALFAPRATRPRPGLAPLLADIVAGLGKRFDLTFCVI